MGRIEVGSRWLVLGLALLGPLVGLGAFALDAERAHSMVTAVLSYLPFVRRDRPASFGLEVFLAYEVLIGLVLLSWAFRRERELRRRNELMERVVHSVSEGVVAADTEGRFLVANRAAREIAGIRRSRRLEVADWSGRYGLYLPGTDRLYPPDELPLSRAIHGEAVPETEVLVRKPGSAAGTWASVTAAPIRDRAGTLLGGVAVFRDITKRKRAEELAQRLSSAVEQTADCVFITDRHGRIEYVNPAFETTTGYSRAEAVGATPSLLKSGKHGAEFYRELWGTITSGATFKATVINRRRNGEHFIAEQTITPMRDSHTGEVTHFVALMRDLTERLQLEEQGRDLQLAAAMQRRLFPRTPPNIPGWDIAGAFSPALATCGDFFDFIELPGNRLLVAVADVCGHGTGPALITATTRSYLRSLARAGIPLEEVGAEVNKLLVDDLDGRRFVTMLLASLETPTGAVTWANMGHPSGFVLGPDGALRARLASTTRPLGLFRGTAVPLGAPLTLTAGETLLLVTDGAVEAESPTGDEHGADGVLKAAAARRDRPAREIVDAVVAAARHHLGGAPQGDDITAVVAKRTE